MKPLLQTLLDGLRLLFLRAPRGRAITAGPGTFFAMVALGLVVLCGVSTLDAGAFALSVDDAMALLVEALVTLFAAWLMVRLCGRDVTWGTAAILTATSTFALAVLYWPFDLAASRMQDDDLGLFAGLFILAVSLWWLLALLVLAHWLAPRRFARTLGVAALAFAVTALSWWLPAVSVLTSAEQAMLAETGDDTPPDEAGADEAPAFDAEKLMYDQPALLDAALARLKPQTPGSVDLYVVAFAGDAQENVFRNEAEYVEQLFGQRFGAAGRVLVLENNAATIATRPLASWTNLQRGLDAIARTMDPSEDVLLLYLTTHGSADHQLLVDLDPLPLNQIEPQDLADVLKTDPRLRWKVVVVNACYSGGFVDALRDDSTMVIASARADRTSFGCGADSDITYFGKAFLAEALNQTTSIRDAFERAKASVAQWEATEQQEHSEPQIATSPAIEARLDAWQRTLQPGAIVPFAPAGAKDGSRADAENAEE
ncbi:C13 family peptidase [Dokdonella ginsengisoli]|uniref:C13 family peptidase n=1 Tax=Dokdonella ginsengisoli TaxID=363846 RepID=A0ABV9QWE5_9GAMM